MRDDLTAILMILDRSGSMTPLADDTVGGLHNFLEQQKGEPGEAVVTLVLFNQEYEPVYQARPLRQVEPLTRKQYNAGGMRR